MPVSRVYPIEKAAAGADTTKVSIALRTAAHLTGR